MSQTYVFDLDGTLCTLTNGVYLEAEPIVERISIVNDLFSRGNKILIYTARGMGRFSNDSQLASEAFRQLTEDQLKNWGINYHELFLGKPAGDLYIDDKAMRESDFFNNYNKQ